MGDNTNPSIDQVIYCVYKNYKHMDKNTAQINNTDIFSPEGLQVTDITKDDEV